MTVAALRRFWNWLTTAKERPFYCTTCENTGWFDNGWSGMQHCDCPVAKEIHHAS